MKVVLTGGHGFLGWHTACLLQARHAVEPVRLGRAELADEARLARELDGADVVLHLAGVNRAESDEAVREGNVLLARQLADAVVAADRPLRIVYADSIQAESGTPYGEGKAEAARILQEAAAKVGGSLADVLLPNLFGEHGRPDYNSVVATFCHRLATGEVPTVVDDKELPLLHAQAAADRLISAGYRTEDETVRPGGAALLVSEVLDRLTQMHETYARGEVPDLADDLSVDLFNTYRSHVFPQAFPMHPPVHADERGELFEVARSQGGPGQVFVSTTRPGATRGDHYHLRRFERFFVVHGEAEIGLRRLLHDDVVTFRLSGTEPGFVDMPSLWVHHIRNIGQDELVTAFWSNQLHDPHDPDQYPEPVEVSTP